MCYQLIKTSYLFNLETAFGIRLKLSGSVWIIGGSGSEILTWREEQGERI